MTPRELRSVADRVEKLCVEGSHGARSKACVECQVYASKLRRFAQEISYGRQTVAIDEAIECEVLRARSEHAKALDGARSSLINALEKTAGQP